MASHRGPGPEQRGTKRKRTGEEPEPTAFGDDNDQHDASAAEADCRCAKAPARSSGSPASDVGITSSPPPRVAPAAKDDEYWRTLYSGELDFRALGQRDPAFQAVLKESSSGGGVHLDFGDPAALVQLTTTLLRVDFGLRVELPADRLCPAVPNRHSYIVWLKDLLDSTASPWYPDAPPAEKKVVGLDVGTGASLIYPLLGCAQRPDWSFVATDVDAASLRSARRNLDLNPALRPRIRIVDRGTPPAAAAAARPLVPLDELGLDALDFVMTNPPFYASAAELAALAARKDRPPSGACTGAPVEMVYPGPGPGPGGIDDLAAAGGEVDFVGRLLDESLALRGRVRWYTAMLGRLSSVEALVAALRRRGVANYALATFSPGARTRRWALAWSFGAARPCARAARAAAGLLPPGKRALLPPPPEATLATRPGGAGARARLARRLRAALAPLRLAAWTWDARRARGVGYAAANVWGRAHRRRRERAGGAVRGNSNDNDDDDVAPPRAPEHPSECALGFSVAVARGAGGEEVAAAVARWVQGYDHALFESFAEYVRRALAAGEGEGGGEGGQVDEGTEGSCA
ncbi:hypothetical protein GGS23DRAFT_598332 [Durotheca rogersii]|uniref:uncharacterized protein n=1 Tax=Durotheca rogersii TaxID=419775 RepID=UPI002220E51E|nr:uncharacterized protein GGS23DRAFT_598332 [Durotheca rogersii]KAI5861552.1 hypothetical protein GGS23DRAFT_598332 [Durotheca rogersii]